MPHIAIVGAGPAGLIAADHLAGAGFAVTLFDRMAAPGRKFLMAGRGGLNLTHSEEFPQFLARYGAEADWMRPYLEAFPPSALRAWADGLGAACFVGSSGRVFPKAMKASPLLRALLARLDGAGVQLRLRHDWLGWDDSGALRFATADGEIAVSADATLLALGGASWPKLGANGAWADILGAHGVQVMPFKPANCGFLCQWSERFRAFAGTPLKSVELRASGMTSRGEAVITAQGIEGGGVYALSRPLREKIDRVGRAILRIDLRPDLDAKTIAAKLATVGAKQSLATVLRKALALPPVAVNLMREVHGVALPREPAALAACVKKVPLTLIAPTPLERAISSAGGIALEELDGGLRLRKIPGTYAAGEMLDWEAPTGGYLLTACFATGMAAARAIRQSLARSI